jgi:hypothetical protein
VGFFIFPPLCKEPNLKDEARNPDGRRAVFPAFSGSAWQARDQNFTFARGHFTGPQAVASKRRGVLPFGLRDFPFSTPLFFLLQIFAEPIILQSKATEQNARGWGDCQLI